MNKDMTPAAKETVGKAIDPHDAYVLVVEDNLQNLVLIARLLAFTPGSVKTHLHRGRQTLGDRFGSREEAP